MDYLYNSVNLHVLRWKVMGVDPADDAAQVHPEEHYPQTSCSARPPTRVWEVVRTFATPPSIVK